jgi:hypothetical protein
MVRQNQGWVLYAPVAAIADVMTNMFLKTKKEQP